MPTDHHDLIRGKTDVVIIGGGLAGLFWSQRRRSARAPRPHGRKAVSQPQLPKATAPRRTPPTRSRSVAASSTRG